MASDKHILAKADTHTGTYVDLASEVGLSVPTLNTTAKNCKPTGRSYKSL